MNPKTRQKSARAKREARIRALIIHDLEVGLYSANGPYIGVLDVITEHASPVMLGVDVLCRWVGGMERAWGVDIDSEFASLYQLSEWDRPLEVVAEWLLGYDPVHSYYEQAERRLR